MAEPTRPSLSAVEVAERDDLLATKLHVPGRVGTFCPVPACWNA